jgi:hypothetical protein
MNQRAGDRCTGPAGDGGIIQCIDCVAHPKEIE